MHKWRKCRIELDDHFFAFEADRVGDFIAVDAKRNECRINQTDFNIFVVRLKSNFFAGTFASASLDFFDNFGHFVVGNRRVGVAATIANRSGVTLDELTGNTNDNFARTDICHIFGFDERLLANFGDTSNVGDGTIDHIAGRFMSFADADNFNIGARFFRN